MVDDDRGGGAFVVEDPDSPARGRTRVSVDGCGGGAVISDGLDGSPLF